MKPIHQGAEVKTITISLQAEVTAKGQVFLYLPKDKFRVHRENVERIMIQYKGEENGS